MYESGDAADVIDEFGQPLRSDSLLLLLNAGDERMAFELARAPRGQTGRLVLDTARPEEAEGARGYRGGAGYPLEPQSMAILKHRTAASA